MIELLLREKSLARAPYKMAPRQLRELEKQLEELIRVEHIQPSQAPFSVPIIFQQKKDGPLRLYVDYRELNKITMKNKYPIPNVDELFDQLDSA